MYNIQYHKGISLTEGCINPHYTIFQTTDPHCVIHIDAYVPINCYPSAFYQRTAFP